MKALFKFLPFIILIFGLWEFYGFYNEKSKRMEELDSEIIEINNNNNSIQEDIKKIKSVSKGSVDELQKKVLEAKGNLDKVSKLIPPISDKTVILEELSSVARDLNIRDISFKPKYEKENHDGLYITNGIEFKGKGTFLQFLVFFEKIKKLDRIFNIDSLKVQNKTLKKSGKHVLVDFKAVIETFHYSSVAETEDKNRKKR